MARIDERRAGPGGRPILVPVCLEVDGLDGATRFYEQAVGTRAEADLELGGGVRARRVGQVLLVVGPEQVLAEVRRLRGIVIVEDLVAAIEVARRGGGVVVKDIVPVGDGQLSHVRHPDGSIFEYLAL